MTQADPISMPTYSLLVQSTVISMDAYKQHRSLRVQKLQRCQLNFAQPAERKHVLCKGLMLSAVKMGYNSAKQLDCHQPLLFPTCRKRKKLFLPKPKCHCASPFLKAGGTCSRFGAASALSFWFGYRLQEIQGERAGARNVTPGSSDSLPRCTHNKDLILATRLCKSPDSLAVETKATLELL